MNIKDERMWGMLVHIATFAGFIVPVVGSVLGPLVIWLIKRDQSYFVDRQGKEAVNFNISMAIYIIGSYILMLILIGYLTLIAAGITWIVCSIIAATKANNGEFYRYPLTIRFIK
ncbi:DUF4870 domain-containing protein [Paenibacillus endoradicis]|uniref:DUF4870 domain-containing protein n=1 Tax=Paenibacillus endoradicis TaxID=2972487 RepID=UPI002158B3B4|nr:DUF4870 domain-containing protein [Paenibacillus endoradicis]MCR8660426.1 DUF4870 domain-containing protein [Paenibacillus endoradicis]